MAGLTEEELKARFSKMSILELNEYATDNGLPLSEDKPQQIDILLGKCHGCGKNNNMTVVYKKGSKNITLANTEQPCSGCNK